jgi:hypothetical protein
MQQKKEISLKVMEALQEEVYKGIVRIDSETMHLIEVRPGDIVEIEGIRLTAGIVDRAYPTDVGQAVIRMDGIMRRNARTGIGEIIKVRKAEVKEAKNVVLAPSQEGVMIQANPEIFKHSLLGRAVVKGDIIVLGGSRRRRKTMDSSFDENEKYQEIKAFIEQKLSGCDYHCIIAISQITDASDVRSIGFTVTSISGKTPFASIKTIIANTIAQFQGLLNIYEVQPAEPIIRPKGDGYGKP